MLGTSARRTWRRVVRREHGRCSTECPRVEQLTSHALECVFVVRLPVTPHILRIILRRSHKIASSIRLRVERICPSIRQKPIRRKHTARSIVLRILRNPENIHHVVGRANGGMTVFDSLAKPGRCNMQAGGAAKHNTILQIAANPCERRGVRGCS